MAYEVLNDFLAKEHNNEIYRKGDIYPKPSFKATKTRVAFLQEVHHEYGIAFLGDEIKVEEQEEVKKPQTTKKVVKQNE